jgi:hypothetical protein
MPDTGDYNMKKHTHLGKVIVLFMALCLLGTLFLAGSMSGEGETSVGLSPSSQTVSAGSTFTVDIVVDPQVPIAGVQANMSFDHELLSANSVTEGNLLSSSCTTFFMPGIKDNTAGTITGMACAVLGNCTASSPGTFARITFTAKTSGGTSQISLSNVKVLDTDVTAVPISVTGGSVTVQVEPTPTPTPTPTLTSTPTPTPGPGISITLSVGWNFIAGPDGTMSVDVALASISGKYLWITTCDPSESPAYKTYVPSNTSDSNLTQMDRLHGYWIFMTQGEILTYPE